MGEKYEIKLFPNTQTKLETTQWNFLPNFSGTPWLRLKLQSKLLLLKIILRYLSQQWQKS